MTWLDDPVLANDLQWDGRTPGHYEEYSLNVVDPSNEAGWWLRYGVDSPMGGEDGSSLWGGHFSKRSEPRRFALRTNFGVRSFAKQSDGFHIRVSKSELTRSGAKGGLRNPREEGHELRWNLSLSEQRSPLQVFEKERSYEGRSPGTKVLVPLPMARAEGVVEVGDGRYMVRSGRAFQAHRWGTSRFDRWTMGYATFFRERPQAYVYAFLGEDEDGRIGSVHYRDEDGFSLMFPEVETSQDEGPGLKPGVWTFKAKTRGWELTGRFSASLQRMMGVRFEDPDGSIRYAHHGGIADATLELWKRSWGRKQLHQTLTARGTCAFEQGSRRRFEDVEFFV